MIRAGRPARQVAWMRTGPGGGTLPMVKMSREDFDHVPRGGARDDPRRAGRTHRQRRRPLSRTIPEDEPTSRRCTTGPAAHATAGSSGAYAGAAGRVYVYMNPTLRSARPRRCQGRGAVTVIHEIAHHFGIDANADRTRLGLGPAFFASVLRRGRLLARAAPLAAPRTGGVPASPRTGIRRASGC